MTDENLGAKLIKGSVWMLAMRWCMRFIGLASMSIVARLLSPDDFGLFAVATSSIGLLDAFTDIGADAAIIKHKNPQRQHYNTVWTFNILVNVGVAFVIVLCTPLAVNIYGDERYRNVLYILALAIFINGFSNIGIADFRRNLQFHKDFKFSLTVQLIGVTATIVCAFWLRSYWALVLGNLARSVSGVAISYLMHHYRPWFSMQARHEMLGFSFWIMIRSLAMFLSGRGDRLVIGAFFKPMVTGWYAIAGDLAIMAVFELLHPIGRALLPGLAAKQQDKEWERRNLRKIFNGTATIAVAMGVGIAAVSEPVVTLIYGANFAAAAPLLRVMAIATAIDGFSQPVGQYLVIHGKAKELALLFMFGGIVSVCATYGLAQSGFDIIAISYARLVVSLFALMRVFYLTNILRGIYWRDIVTAWSRPILAGMAMYAAVEWLQHEITLQRMTALIMELNVPVDAHVGIENIHRLVILLASGASGAIVYSSVLLVFWRILGRPAGIEEEIISRVLKPK